MKAHYLAALLILAGCSHQEPPKPPTLEWTTDGKGNVTQSSVGSIGGFTITSVAIASETPAHRYLRLQEQWRTLTDKVKERHQDLEKLDPTLRDLIRQKDKAWRAYADAEDELAK